MQHENTIYQPIGNNAIRLLSIKPALPDEQIECALITINNLEDTPAFEAVSYLSDQELSPDPALCNGARKSVTRNVDNALRCLRPFRDWASVPLWSTRNALHSSRSVWHGFARNRYEHADANLPQMLLWIDAICINQDDAAEKASQAKLRARIFQKASTVKICLGNETANMPIILSFVAQVLRNATKQQADVLPSHDKEKRNKAYGFPNSSAENWKVLDSFFASPWFEQVWTVQEVVFAQRAVVIVGDWLVDWAAIGQSAAWFVARGYSLRRSLTAPNARENGLRVAAAAALWEMHGLAGKRAPLLCLLKEFRLRHADRQADKLYATLHLAEETASSGESGWPLLLEPDYDRTLEAIYRDAARFLIIENGSLLVLSQVDRQSSQSPTLPSWVPDWSRVKASSAIWETPEQRGRGADGHEHLSIGIAEDENCLVLEGMQADSVLYYTHMLQSRNSGEVVYEKERIFVSDAWRLAMGRVGDQGAAKAREAMTRDFVEALTMSPGRLANDDCVTMKEASSWFRKYFLGHNLQGGARWKWMSDSKVDTSRFHQALVRACTDRRFFVTRNGLMGIGPSFLAAGDTIVILFGGKVPFVLRRRGLSQRYSLIGECYIPGLMNGEAVEYWRASGQGRETFEII